MNTPRLTQDLYCLDYDPVTDDDLLLPEGTLIRNPHRVGESELLGAEWRFHASTDGGRTWVERATMLELQVFLPRLQRRLRVQRKMRPAIIAWHARDQPLLWDRDQDVPQ